jgi:peptidyl-prolyl cis-trans isomerase SurA
MGYHVWMKLIIVMVTFWGTLTQAEALDQVVAVVNEEVITSSELDQKVKEMKEQMLAKQLTLPDDAVLRKQVLQHLIDVDLQLQLAKQQHFSIEDNEVDAAIQNIATQNHATLDQLKEAIAQHGMDWKTYRENIRKEMTVARVQQKAVAHEIQVNASQVELYLKKARQEKQRSQALYHLQNIVIPLPSEPTSDQVKAAEAKANALLLKIKQGADFSKLAIEESSGALALDGGDLGERHLAELPDVFAKEVMTMDPGTVHGPIRTGNGFQLLKLISMTVQPEKHLVNKTHVRHILIKQQASMTKEDAKLQRDHLYQQLKTNGDFARLAKQYSLDAVSATQGGDLGWVAPGDLVPEFEKVMNELPLHVVSQPVKTRFGWHFIEVLERKQEDDTAAYERQEVRAFLQQRKFSEAVQSWQQRLRGQAYIKVMDKATA